MGASENIDNMIANLPDWRGKTLTDIRRVIREADPEIVEEIKFRGALAWSHEGIVCLAVGYKVKVKLNFYKGASIPDPDGLYNDRLEGGQARAIAFFCDDKIREPELKRLVRAAVDYNVAKVKTKAKPRGKKAAE